MHTKAISEAPVALFLFAHQDDEFGVFNTIHEYRRRNIRVACAYLTRGVNNTALRRNNESLRVLRSLGVSSADISFAGDDLGIDDSTLYKSLDRADAWIERWISSFKTIEKIHILAWEGGHHDHDALHAVAARVAFRLGYLSRTRQFALYNGYRCPKPFFKVLKPLAENGPVELYSIPILQRLFFLRLCLLYPSQRLTWIGLFPFILFDYVIRGRQSFQAVRLERINERPHRGALYYEQRNFCRWELMRERLQEWQSKGG